MGTFELTIWDDESRKVTFYSPRWEDSEHSEMDKFLLRMEGIPGMKRPLQELLALIIDVIGNTHGAREAFFNRFENKVTALPPRGSFRIREIGLNYEGFPLRLYCLALNREAVILFNGGIKNSQTVQESSDVISVKFYEANKFAARITDAIHAGDIAIDGRHITDYKGDTEIYL